MMSPDLQRIQHIKEYCAAIGKTIERYGNSFEIYAADEDFQRSVSFSILQIGELSGGLSAGNREPYPVGAHEGHAESGRP